MISKASTSWDGSEIDDITRMTVIATINPDHMGVTAIGRRNIRKTGSEHVRKL
jgi:hypothetical protein